MIDLRWLRLCWLVRRLRLRGRFQLGLGTPVLGRYGLGKPARLGLLGVGCADVDRSVICDHQGAYFRLGGVIDHEHLCDTELRHRRFRNLVRLGRFVSLGRFVRLGCVLIRWRCFDLDGARGEGQPIKQPVCVSAGVDAAFSVPAQAQHVRLLGVEEFTNRRRSALSQIHTQQLAFGPGSCVDNLPIDQHVPDVSHARQRDHVLQFISVKHSESAGVAAYAHKQSTVGGQVEAEHLFVFEFEDLFDLPLRAAKQFSLGAGGNVKRSVCDGLKVVNDAGFLERGPKRFGVVGQLDITQVRNDGVFGLARLEIGLGGVPPLTGVDRCRRRRSQRDRQQRRDQRQPTRLT